MKGIIALAAVAGFASAATADIIVSEVVDGDLSGGNPKFVELTNTGGAAVTFGALDSVQVFSNGNGVASATVSLDGITIGVGESFVIASTANGGQAQFLAAYGFDADLYTGSFFGNGNDAYGLNVGGTIVDIFGNPADVSGGSDFSAVWAYNDSYAFRNANSITAGAFSAADWTYGGSLALDAGDDATRIALLQQFTTPGTHNFVPAPGAVALLGMGGLLAARRRR